MSGNQQQGERITTEASINAQKDNQLVRLNSIVSQLEGHLLRVESTKINHNQTLGELEKAQLIKERDSEINKVRSLNAELTSLRAEHNKLQSFINSLAQRVDSTVQKLEYFTGN